MHVLILSSILILFISKCLCKKRKEAVKPAFNHAYQTSIRADSQTSLSLTSLTVTSRPCNDKFILLKWPNTSARYASIINSLIAKLDMEISFVFLKKNFNLISQFIQPMKASVSRQPTDFSIKQKSHEFCSHFFGQKLEEPIIFCSQTNEVDHFDHNVHNLHQMRR